MPSAMTMPDDSWPASQQRKGDLRTQDHRLLHDEIAASARLRVVDVAAADAGECWANEHMVARQAIERLHRCRVRRHSAQRQTSVLDAELLGLVQHERAASFRHGRSSEASEESSRRVARWSSSD